MAMCNICGCEEFTNFKNRTNVLCKNCKSLERHRSLHYVLTSFNLIDDNLENLRILHISPEACSYNFFRKKSSLYICAAEHPENFPYAECVKLTFPNGLDMFPSNFFDLIIHNHVLPQIQTDVQGVVDQFNRILKSNGSMVFTLPPPANRIIQDIGKLIDNNVFMDNSSSYIDFYNMHGNTLPELFRNHDGTLQLYSIPQDISHQINSEEKVFIYNKNSASKPKTLPIEKPFDKASGSESRQRNVSIWASNLESELSYWKSNIGKKLADKGQLDEFMGRIEGIDIAPPVLHTYLADNPRILDVGAGPCTVIGAKFEGKVLDVTAVDPLAREYNDLLKEYDLHPHIITRFAIGEKLSDFVTGKFDLVYSQNALDHTTDPIAVIQSMLEVCAPEGNVILRNIKNEGLRENYHGLHQWNFMPASNDMVIWNKTGRGKILSKELDSRSFTTINVTEDGIWINVIIAKSGSDLP